jgi:hypothetical protein
VIVGTGVAASETTLLTVFEHVVAVAVSVTEIVKLPPARLPARTVADAVLTPAVIVPLPVIAQLYVLFGALLAVENVATALSHIVVGPLITGVGVARTLIVLRATQPAGVVSVSVTVAEFVGVEPQVTVIVFWFRAVTVDGLATVPAPVAPPGVVIVPPTTSHLYVSPV